ncbi:MauE/DoxX family redox-associated membrane protein [Gynurincola endophyticus]|uniref:MauE/DoxX family redox-associated membrane protein n=1 Tax=Gynurincola endophyticus TaxID=2479004 RepID=UPI000F8C524C|nr:MauE/DoxX family redox-associated membrane protein [Gynurincola endophyticus]
MRKQWIGEGMVMIIVCLYVFVAVSKVVGFDPFVSQLKQQQFIGNHAVLIAIIVPLLHALLAALIFIEKTRTAGLIISMLTLMGYNLYIASILLNKLGLAPCNCVGIWHTMSWETQYIINFLLLFMHWYCINNPIAPEKPTVITSGITPKPSY